MHHNTKFGNKKFGGLEHIIWANIHQHIEICCDLDLEHNNPISPYNTLAYDNVVSNQVWQQKDQQFKRYSRN